MKIILLSFLIFLVANTRAQTDSFNEKKPDSLYFKTPFFRLYPVIYNNELQLRKEEAKALFSKVPESYEHYKKYVRRHKAGLYSFAGIFAGITSSIIGLNNGNRGLMAIGLTTAVATLYSSIYFFVSSDSQLRKAIKVYNQTVRF